MEKAIELTSTFYTSDAEYPDNFKCDDGKFTLSYRNADDQMVCVIFVDTLAFRWQEFDDDRDDEIPEDGSYEIINSDWLFQKSRDVPDILSYRHFRLGFNEIGNFEILCKEFLIAASDEI